MKPVRIDTSYLDEQNHSHARLSDAISTLENKTWVGSDYLGWVDLPNTYDKQEFARIKEVAKKIHDIADVLVVIGIGGSYLGARAAIEFVGNTSDIQVVFAGNHMSSRAIHKLLEDLDGKQFAINVISKSGTTTEPALAFRILKTELEKRYGKDDAKERIFATTDAQKWALRTLAQQEGYETFIVPDDVGGRYSVLTAVGLLPIAVAGVDIDALMQGAREAMQDTTVPDNDCYKYTSMRNMFYEQGKKVELLVNYEPHLHYFGEWWKQLFGESEGKEGKGLYPDTLDFSTDLHSLGQYVQEGERLFIESVLWLEDDGRPMKVVADEKNLDGLNYLEGKTLHEVNESAMKATVLAHSDGGVPNTLVRVKDTSAHTLGYLFYFFEKACALSGYILGVNPFNQPGVEAYKTNMFALLGKPGFEDQTKAIQKRIL